MNWLRSDLFLVVACVSSEVVDWDQLTWYGCEDSWLLLEWDAISDVYNLVDVNVACSSLPANLPLIF